jgi:hypothetical protein
MSPDQQHSPAAKISLSILPLFLVVLALTSIVPRDLSVSLAQEATATRPAPAPTRPGGAPDRDTPAPPTTEPQPTVTPEPPSPSKPEAPVATPAPVPALMPLAGGVGSTSLSLVLAGLAFAAAGITIGAAHRRENDERQARDS